VALSEATAALCEPAGLGRPGAHIESPGIYRLASTLVAAECRSAAGGDERAC
jgi:hypothetical protein